MKHKNILNFIGFLLFIQSIISCQKVVNINLNSSSPQYVIEANVTDSVAPYTVKITRSVNFDQDNVFPTVSGAKVTITDKNTGHVDSMYETSPGFYQTTGLLTGGTPGHTYFLSINVDGKILTATSTMPLPVLLDSLYTQIMGFRDNAVLVPQYTDPIATGNFYHFLVTKNDTISGNIFIRSDNLVNGQTMKQPLGGGQIRPGDFISVEMQCIDSMVYQFYSTLEQSRSSNSATPTNPVSNIIGGQALGYFSAHTVSTKSIIVPF